MTYKNLVKFATIGSFALGMLSPLNSFAEANDHIAASQSNQAMVHRVTHSLANSQSYTRSGHAGYKWGKDVQSPDESANWATSSTSQSGYKWGSGTASADSGSQSYASTSGYQWGSMSFAEQSAYRWGLRSFADQSAYRWGLRSFADQSAYRWGLRSLADQSAYRWGLR